MTEHRGIWVGLLVTPSKGIATIRTYGLDFEVRSPVEPVTLLVTIDNLPARLANLNTTLLYLF